MPITYAVEWYAPDGTSHETARTDENTAYSTRDHLRANGVLNAIVLAYYPGT